MPSKKLIAFPYYGGKHSEVDFIRPLLPATNTYVEPFCGAATILLNRSRSNVEVLNDLNKDIANLFSVLRDAPELLLRLLYLTPYSRDEFDMAASMMKGDLDASDEDAARLWYMHQLLSLGGKPEPNNYMISASPSRDSGQIYANYLGALSEEDLEQARAWYLHQYGAVGGKPNPNDTTLLTQPSQAYARKSGDIQEEASIEEARLWYMHQQASAIRVPRPTIPMGLQAESKNVGSTPCVSSARYLGDLADDILETGNAQYTLPFLDRVTSYDGVLTSPLGLVAKRLQDVVVENMTAIDVISKYDDKDTLFYCDPPYVMQSRTHKGGYFDLDMDDKGHRDLADALHSAKALVAISGYASALYDELYKDWYRFEANVKVSRSAIMGAAFTKGKAVKGAKRQEVMWANYRPSDYGLGILF